MKRGRPNNKELRNQIKEYIKKGLKNKDICRILDISQQLLCYYKRKLSTGK